jgi:ketosteroid isomerase-like protein
MKSPLVLLFLFLFGLAPSSARSQSSATPDRLFQTIQSLDNKLFDAYNHCDLTTLASLVSEDLEFYHDKTGLARGRQSFLDSIRNNICGKVTRELVPGTLQVYPLAHYGAVEIGTHRFHHPGHDDDVGEAQFITLWQKKGDAWHVTRVISFDHRPLTK